MPVVHIDPDEMAADLVLIEGERVASTNVAIVLLARNGVKHGLLHAELAKLPGLVGPTALRVAIGEPPLAGADGRVMYGFAIDQEPDSPTRGPDGAPCVDAPCEPQIVTPGELLARRHPALPGQAGRTVTGRTLPIPQVGEPPFQGAGGTEPSLDGLYLVATRTGVPHMRLDGVVEVRPLLRIEGNLEPDGDGLELAGDVVIDGDVMVEGHVELPTGIAVAGDVYILGGVQGTPIRAGGRIVVTGGVRQGARLVAGGRVHAKFVEGSSIEAGGAVVVREDLLRSTVIAPRAIVGGAVVGGELSLVAWLEAGELGAAMTVATRVAVVPPPPPEDDGKAIARERRELADKLTRLGILVDENRRLAMDPRNESAREMMTKLVGLIAHLQRRDRELVEAACEATPVSLGVRPFARVRGALHPGVTLQLGGQHMRPTTPIPSSCFLEGAKAVEIAPYDIDPERILA